MAGYLKRTQPSTEVFHRTGEDLAVGEVELPVAGDEDPFLDRHLQVHVGAFQDDPVMTFEPVHQFLLLLPGLFPKSHRVGLVEHHGAEDELAVIRQAHVGFLGHGVGGIDGQAPAQVAFGGAVEEDLLQAGAGLGDPRHAGCGSMPESERVLCSDQMFRLASKVSVISLRTGET